jgi:hypothetical protein
VADNAGVKETHKHGVALVKTGAAPRFLLFVMPLKMTQARLKPSPLRYLFRFLGNYIV